MRIAGLVAMLIVGCRGEPAPVQPIAFNHEIHAGEQNIACVYCHVGAETMSHASLPALSRCLTCHMKPQGKQPNPRENVVRELAIKRVALRWTQITRNAGHVHFSHAAHVSIVKMPCTDCHGDVTKWTEPPTAPDPALTNMGACVACHRQHDAPTDCDTCHQ